MSAESPAEGSREGARPRTRTTLIIVAVLAAAGAALIVSQLLGGEGGAGSSSSSGSSSGSAEVPQATPELTVELHHGETPIRTLRTASPGDRMIVRTKAAAAVWLYLDGETLIASCPGDARCSQQGADGSLELTLETPGEYRAVLLQGKGAPPAPTASLKDGLAAARSTGFSVLSATPVQVR